MSLEIFADNMKQWENFVAFTVTLICVGVFIGAVLGRFLKTEKIAQLKQKIKDNALQYNVLVNGLKADEKYSLRRIAKLEAALEKRDSEVIKLRGQVAERERIAQEAIMKLDKAPKVLVVPNVNPHQAADVEYIGIYPSPDSGLEPSHLTREVYQGGVKRLKDHPEDKLA